MTIPSQSKEDPYCLECHWESFHVDDRDSEATSGANHQPQWNCPGGEHHNALDNCDFDEACCDMDDCTFNCSSVCDGFVDCDTATACTVAPCDDTQCDDTGPVCFDEHCFGEDGTDQGLESLLPFPGHLRLDANDLLSSMAVPHNYAEQPARSADRSAPGAIHTHSTENLLTPYSSTGNYCDHTSLHHLNCHNFSNSKSSDGSLVNPSYPTQNGGVNPAEVFHMLGMCADPSGGHHFHYHLPEGQNNLGKPNGNSFPVPLACFPPGYPHFHIKNPQSGNPAVIGPCRTQHRCRAHPHAHPHLYSPYSRNSRSSVSSHLISSPGETPPPLDAATPSVLTSRDFSPVESELHTCKWTAGHGGLKSTCGATFPDSGALQEHLIAKHLITVDGPKGNGYYCRWDGCHRADEPFSQKAKLQGHFLTHSNYKNFKCSVCGKSFARQATLERHERSHRGEKPYTCPDCGKSFTDSSELKTHSRTHTGEKPFRCTYPGCDFQTGDSSNMSSHRLTHGERKHKCLFPGCNKSFTRPDQLKRHMRTTHKQESPNTGFPSPISDDFALSFGTIH